MKSQPMWNAYVVGGKTREECRKRLEEVPAEWRQVVGHHAKTYFAIQANKGLKTKKRTGKRKNAQ